MAISWSRCTIKDFLDNGEAEIKTGPFGTQLHASDYVEQGTPVINVRNIGFGEIRPENLEFIADETVKRLSSHLLDAGDIVFGRKGAVERHAFIKSKWAGWFQGSDCLRVRFKSPSVESRFLSYCFLSEKHKQWMINQCSHGATMASLNQDIICRIPLRLPPIDTQKKITAVLSGYDDLIENNTRRIRILEEVAQAIYREWFVHFRFPGHKKVKLVNSPIGQIPDGWRAGRLDEAVVLQRGFDLPGSSRRQGNVPVYAATGVVGKHDEAKVNGPGVVTGRSGSLGTVIYVPEDYWPLNTTLWVKEFRRSTPLHAYFLLSGLDFSQFNSGAAVPTLNRNDVHGLPIVLPPAATLAEFDKNVAPIYELISSLRAKNDCLRRTRDLLLPKLISGELDVSDLDFSLGDATA